MPPFVRFLINILIGMTGVLIWAWASIGITVMFTIKHDDWQHDLARGWLTLASFTGMNLIGYSMFIASELVDGIPEFKMPSRRLPLFLGLRLMEQLLAVLGLTSLFHSGAFLGAANGANPGIGAASAVVLYLAFKFTNRIKRVRGEQWRKELPDEPHPPEFQ